MSIRRLTQLAICLVILTAAAALAARDKWEKDPRVQEAKKELADAEALRKSATNAAERTIWAQRVALAGRRLDSAKRLAQLREREETFASERRARVDYALREALGTVDADVSDPERAIRNLKSKIRRRYKNRYGRFKTK